MTREDATVRHYAIAIRRRPGRPGVTPWDEVARKVAAVFGARWDTRSVRLLCREVR